MSTAHTDTEAISMAQHVPEGRKEGHGVKGREQEQGEVEWHQERSRGGPLRRKMINTVLMKTASVQAQHSRLRAPRLLLRSPLGSRMHP